MQKYLRHGVAPMISVATMVFLAAFSGCKKDSAPTAPSTDRMQDPVYTNALASAHKKQVAIVRRQQTLRANMKRMKERARAALGKDATDEQIAAELAANPAKYPGWRELKAQDDQAEQERKAEYLKTRQIVRARILKETADQKKAAAGTK